MNRLKELVITDIKTFFNNRLKLDIAPMLFNEKEFQMQLVMHLRQSEAAYDNIYI